MPQSTADVLILCQDLFFTSQLTGAAQRAGRQPRTCLSVEACRKALEEAGEQARWVVVDLELPGTDLSQLKSALPEACRLLAFGPHVHTAQIESARSAGCDVVLTRGQAAAQLEEYLREGSMGSPLDRA
jgi:DNA-binding NarL/FixJ family response regulator